MPGIREKIGYLSELGVNAVWLSPINTSPMLDFGYDISDYRGIDPLFGSMADFDALLAELHSNNIKLLLDLVVNHTSSLHPWFVEARSSRESAKRDWYIWREGVKDKPPHAAREGLHARGKVRGLVPPNNWQSVFGGPAWTWDDATGAWYLHSFLAEQPDLNWRNPEVKEAVFADIEFWLKKGVDGFRLDVVNLYFKDAQFRDNPLRLWGWRYPRPYEFQRHVHDMSQPEMHPLLKDLRQLLDRYNATSVGEVLVDFTGDPELAASYLGDGDELHMTFDFTLLYQKWNVADIAKTLRNWYAACGDNWPTLVLGNHDQDRAYSRHAKGKESDARAKILAALLLTAKGTPYLYYGDEIGMKNGKIARHELRDPVGIRFWPLTVSRDPARTPMLWNSAAGAGFSESQPWLPLNDDHADRNLEAQQVDNGSIWHWHRQLLALRKQHAALRRGDWSEIYGGKDVLAFRRTDERETIDVFLNFSDRASVIAPRTGEILLSSHGRTTMTNELAPYEAIMISLLPPN
nr:alpha-glucosidase [Turneriella parva]